MRRFLTIVILIVAIALLINWYLGKEEVTEPDEPAAQQQPEVKVEEPAGPAADESENSAAPASAAPEEQPTSGAEDAAKEAASRGAGARFLIPIEA